MAAPSSSRETADKRLPNTFVACPIVYGKCEWSRISESSDPNQNIWMPQAQLRSTWVKRHRNIKLTVGLCTLGVRKTRTYLPSFQRSHSLCIPALRNLLEVQTNKYALVFHIVC